MDSTSQIRQGMDVYGTDGNKVGTVGNVWPDLGGTGTTNPSGTGTTRGVTGAWDDAAGTGGALGPEGVTDTSGAQTFGSTATGATVGGTPGETVSETVPTVGAGGGSSWGTGYFEVDRGGFLGIGQTSLYIPFNAVQTIDANENRITLNCTVDEASNQYQTHPASLSGSQYGSNT